MTPTNVRMMEQTKRDMMEVRVVLGETSLQMNEVKFSQMRSPVQALTELKLKFSFIRKAKAAMEKKNTWQRQEL